jgi:hypothetical protein
MYLGDVPDVDRVFLEAEVRRHRAALNLVLAGNQVHEKFVQALTASWLNKSATYLGVGLGFIDVRGQEKFLAGVIDGQEVQGTTDLVGVRANDPAEDYQKIVEVKGADHLCKGDACAEKDQAKAEAQCAEQAKKRPTDVLLTNIFVLDVCCCNGANEFQRTGRQLVSAKDGRDKRRVTAVDAAARMVYNFLTRDNCAGGADGVVSGAGKAAEKTPGGGNDADSYGEAAEGSGNAGGGAGVQGGPAGPDDGGAMVLGDSAAADACGSYTGTKGMCDDWSLMQSERRHTRLFGTDIANRSVLDWM